MIFDTCQIPYMVTTRKRVHIIFQEKPNIIQHNEIIFGKICHQHIDIWSLNIPLYRCAVPYTLYIVAELNPASQPSLFPCK